jgi:hypothetical protein
MFTIDPKITARDLKKKILFKVFLSMNIHQVATPETSLEEARSYVFFAREGRNRLSAYIGLHLLQTDRKLFYAHSANPFLEEVLQDVEEEARYFAEDLGAMLDEVDFAGLSEPEQDSWIEGQSIFSQKKQPEAAPVEQPHQLAPAAAVSSVQPPEAPERLTSAPEEIRAPEPPAASVQPVTQAHQPEAQEQKSPREAPVDAQVRQAKASPLAAAKRRQEMQQNAVTTDLEKAPKQTVKKKVFSATGVVSRDREALARLLTSF